MRAEAPRSPLGELRTIAAPRQPDAPLGRARPALRDGQPKWLVRGADELFRNVYTRSGVAAHEMLAVTSALPGEGKTTIALGVAITIAQDFPDLRVTLLETDVRHPVVAADFQVDAVPGLVECLSGEREIGHAYRSTVIPNLRFVPGGAPTPDPARLLRSSRMTETIEALRRESDLLVVDAPAVLANSDALLLADLADVVIVVARAGATPAARLQEAIELLDPTKVRGLVLNAAESAVPRWLHRVLDL